MSFNQSEPLTPTEVTPLRIRLIIGDTPQESSMEYAFGILDQNGGVLDRRQGDAWVHLTPEEKQQLQAMAIRLRAFQKGVLPTP